MRLAIAILLLLHALIHLLGTAKAFGWTRLDTFTKEVPPYAGLAWGLASGMLILTIGLYTSRAHYWWMLGLVSLVLSQILIISYWSDARWGTLPNLLLLVLITTGFARFQFAQHSNKLRQELLQQIARTPDQWSMPADATLPPPVQRWLQRSGAEQHPPIVAVQLEQDLRMRLQPSQTKWTEGTAQQLFSVDPPRFIWTVDLMMAPGLPVQGRDQFRDGQGQMHIRIAGLLPVVNEQKKPTINSASLQRYLGEIAWFPTAAYSQHITWSAIDDRSARATLSYAGTTDSGVFTFDKRGDLESFTADRFQKTGPDAQRLPWTIEVLETAAPAGLRIPVRARAHWELPDGRWTWLQLTITDIRYQTSQPPK